MESAPVIVGEGTAIATRKGVLPGVTGVFERDGVGKTPEVAAGDGVDEALGILVRGDVGETLDVAVRTGVSEAAGVAVGELLPVDAEPHWRLVPLLSTLSNL
jgi:hypothetical protein